MVVASLRALPMRILTAALLALLVAASTARADSFVGIFEPDYASDAKVHQTKPFPSRPNKHLAYPVMGFPSLVEPAGTIPLQLLLPNGGKTADWKVAIETSASPAPVRYTLPLAGSQQYDPATGVYTVVVNVPKDVVPATYDIEVTSADFTLATVDRQPNAVRVLDPKRPNPCFAIIADSQMQDINTPSPPQRLQAMLTEIKLRSPDFVLFCGDWNFGEDYSTEYEQNRRIFAQSGLAMFYVPGNHDGYATVIPLTSGPNPPGELTRDGLEWWKRYVGPTLYSFDWLGQHFVGINSMGGTPERRNAVGILTVNYGGEIDAAQLDWIERDVAAATARGKKTVLYMHHNPSATPLGDKVAYPVPIPTFSWQDWNDPVSKARLDDIVARYDVSHVFYGHIHDDHYEDVKVGNKTVPYVATTTIDCGPTTVLGYRWVQSAGGAISEIHYMGTKQQSVPYPQIGLNLDTSFSGPLDGTASTLSATVTSKLLTAASVVLELPVQPAGALRAEGGVLESVAVTASNVWVARVRATVPASGRVNVSVAPDPTVPMPRSGGTAVAGATIGPMGASGGHGGSGCEIEPPGSSPPASAVPLLLVLGVLLGRKSCSVSRGG